MNDNRRAPIPVRTDEAALDDALDAPNDFIGGNACLERPNRRAHSESAPDGYGNNFSARRRDGHLGWAESGLTLWFDPLER